MIKDVFRSAAKYLIYKGAGLAGAYRSHRKAHRDKAIVLTYHGVLPEIPGNGSGFEYRNFVTVRQFESQLRFLLKYYRPLSAADFLVSGRDRAGGFLITFDDGFRNNLRYAVPVLQRYGVQACFFITTGLIGTRQLLWTEQVTRLLERTSLPKLTISFNGRRNYELDTHLKRERASQEIRRQMKLMPPPVLNTALRELREQIFDVSLELAGEAEERYLMMTWEEVKQMADADQYIGSHTHTHPMLATLPEEVSLKELKTSKELIENHLAAPCELLSYPNGERQNFTDLTKSQLHMLGYKAAFTQIPLFNNGDQDLYEIRRINIGLKMSMPVIEATLCGFKS